MPKERKKQNRELTEKQENFCQYYFDTGGNASEAYRMAYDCSKMKEDTINNNAWNLKKNSEIAARIKEIREERRKASELDRKKVEAVLYDIVTANTADLYFDNPLTGKPKKRTPLQLSERARNAVKRVKVSADGIDYEFHGKTEAARLLGAWNGWDAPKDLNVNHNVSDDVFYFGDFSKEDFND